MEDVPIAQPMELQIAQPIDSEKADMAAKEAGIDLKTLRTEESKAIKSIILGAVAYNTAHRLFTKKEDRGRDLKRAAYKFTLLSDEAAGDVGLGSLGKASVNYIGDNLKDKYKRLFGSGGTRRGKARRTLKKRRRS